MKSCQFFFLILFILLLLFVTFPVNAADFATDYKAEYFPQESNEGVITKVRFTISITNLRSDLYVKKLTLSFPNEFNIRLIYASDDQGRITPQINKKELNTEVELEFNNPQVGRQSVNNFYLEFDQNKLIQVNGNIWEIMLPILNKESRNNYQVVLNLPQLSTKKISIAKPKPNQITDSQIIWNNPETKTIYAVLGSYQYYQLNLVYHLNNPKIVPVYTDIALPPDTLYQKTYLMSLEPKPAKVFLDDDGNYLARYILKPKERSDIIYNGNIEIYIFPRNEVQPYIRKQINLQKKYLFNPDKNWTVSQVPVKLNSKNAVDIYNYVVSNLSYDYHRINKGNNQRAGADLILKEPNNAVCVDFSDLFIALSREKGVVSREIQGYGYSLNSQIRPISLSGDILHSWPEYYNDKLGIWIPVDPTWENTSGIDYFNSFDFNHIVFAIHGKNSDYPVPAGMYKIENSSDITIKPISQKPTESIDIKLKPSNLERYLIGNKSFFSKLVVENNSNVYLWNIPIEYRQRNLILDKKREVIDVLAPNQKKEINLYLKAANLKVKSTGELAIFIYENKLFGRLFTIYPFYYQLVFIISLIILLFSVLYVLTRIFIIFKKRYGNQ